MVNPQLIKLARAALAVHQKKAFTPMDAAGVVPEGDPNAQGGGMPPQDPNAQPPMDPGMDPNAQAPQGDPNAQGGGMVTLNSEDLMQLIQQVAGSMGGQAAPAAPAAPAAAPAAAPEAAKKGGGKKDDQNKLDTVILQLTQLNTLLQSALGMPITPPGAATPAPAPEAPAAPEAAPAAPPAQPAAPPMPGGAGMQVQASVKSARAAQLNKMINRLRK